MIIRQGRPARLRAALQATEARLARARREGSGDPSLRAYLERRVEALGREIRIEENLPEVVKTDFAHRITHGGRGLSPHRECWGARTADGEWSFERLEEPGTPWAIYHEPSRADGSYLGVVATETTLDGCRRAVASGWAAQELGRRKAEQAAEPAVAR